jgi:PAS domain-containing protein
LTLTNKFAYLSIVNDISDRKRAEAEIVHSKDLLESIFNESTDAIFLVNAKTNAIADCNQRAVELFEVTSKEELLNIQGHTLQKETFTAKQLRSIFDQLDRYSVWSRELEYVKAVLGQLSGQTNSCSGSGDEFSSRHRHY